MILKALQYYREKLQLSRDNITSREPGLLPHHEHYLTGKTAYNAKEWLKSADNMEAALLQYKSTLNDCLMMCDDAVFVNMSRSDINKETMMKFEDLKITLDSMEYYTLLQNMIIVYLKCHTDCHKWMATVNGEYFDKYLAGHFHYLQYDYYKCKFAYTIN